MFIKFIQLPSSPKATLGAAQFLLLYNMPTYDSLLMPETLKPMLATCTGYAQHTKLKYGGLVSVSGLCDYH